MKQRLLQTVNHFSNHGIANCTHRIATAATCGGHCLSDIELPSHLAPRRYTTASGTLQFRPHDYDADPWGLHSRNEPSQENQKPVVQWVGAYD